MRMFKQLAALGAALVLAAAPAAAQDVKVIVNSGNATADLPAATVAKLSSRKSPSFRTARRPRRWIR